MKEPRKTRETFGIPTPLFMLLCMCSLMFGLATEHFGFAALFYVLLHSMVIIIKAYSPGAYRRLEMLALGDDDKNP